MQANKNLSIYLVGHIPVCVHASMLTNQPLNTSHLTSDHREARRQSKCTFRQISTNTAFAWVHPQMVIENLFQPYGYVLTICMDGLQCLELIESRNYIPDLVLLGAFCV